MIGPQKVDSSTDLFGSEFLVSDIWNGRNVPLRPGNGIQYIETTAKWEEKKSVYIYRYIYIFIFIMKSHLCFDVPKILQNIKRCSGNMCEMCQLTSFLHPISYKYGNSRSHYITDLLYLQKTITLNHWSVLPQKNGPTVLPYKKNDEFTN